MRKNAKITKVLVLIYSSFKSNRLIYTLDQIFKSRLLLDYTLVDKQELIDSEELIKINYSHEPIADAWQITPTQLLDGLDIDRSYRPQSPNFNDSLAYPVCRIDVFSFVFFHLSRYEEYQIKERDKHGRFEARNSCLYSKNGFHAYRYPVLDILIDQLKAVLTEKYGLKWIVQEPSIFASLDIDSFYAYKGRGLARNLAAIARDCMRLRPGEIFKRLTVLTGMEQDPNDNFDYQLKVLEFQNLKAHYFIQSGPYGPYDKNISPSHTKVSETLKRLKNAGHEIGIHPSYQSESDSIKIKSEIELLESSLGSKITHSRQHFLRLKLPETYRALIECGIEHDWSMGYSEDFGFRAGTSLPFKWFDLLANCSTELTIHPFCAMDVTFKEHMRMNAKRCMEETAQSRRWLQSKNLPFTFIFHNESLSEHRGWKGWRNVFENWTSKT